MALSQKEADIQMMLAAQCHLGTKNCDFQMERYVWRRRQDGIYIMNLAKTWDKLFLAARVIVAIENPGDIIVQSSRPYGQRAVLKFAQYTGAKAIAGRHTPGTYTNQMQDDFEEPRLLILTDPRTDHQPIAESAYVNLPTIAFCDTDSPMSSVDIGIPANNKAKYSIGCLYYLLSRMVLQMRGRISPTNPWEVMVDLFFYREPEEAKEDEIEPAVVDFQPDAAPGYAAAPIAEPWDDGSKAFAPGPPMDGGYGGAVGGVEAGQWAETAPPTGWESAAPPMDFGGGAPVQPPMDFGGQF